MCAVKKFELATVAATVESIESLNIEILARMPIGCIVLPSVCMIEPIVILSIAKT